MSTQYAVDLVFNTQGGGQLGKAARELDKVNNAVQRTNGQLGKGGKAFGSAGKAAQGASVGVKAFGTAVKSALGPIGAALAAVGSLTAAFNTISNQDFAVAKVKSLGVNTAELNAELKQVSAELNNSASVAELTGSAYDVASAGFTNAADAAQVLKAASMGATGGFTDMNTAGNALTSVLNAYGKSASEATQVMDQFITTQNQGKIVVAEYAQNIGKVASAAASLGVPLEEVNAIIAQSTAAGVQAEVAFTGLKSAIARLASGEANKALEEYGVSINAATIESEGLAGSLKQIVDAGVDTGTLLKALGTEAGPALLPVLNNLEKFNELLEGQKNAAGAAAAANKIATDTIQGAWKQLTNTFSNFFADQTALGDLLKLTLQGITIAVDGITKAVNLALTPFKVLVGIINGVKQAADQLAAGFEAAFDSAEGRALLKVVGEVREKIDELIEGVGKYLKGAWEGVLNVVFEIGKFIGQSLLQQIENTINALEKLFGWLPLIGDKIKEAKKAWDEFKEGIDEAAKGTEKAQKKTEDLKDETEKAKEKALELANEMKKAGEEAQAAAEKAQQALKDNAKLYQAEYDLNSALNDIKLENAEIELKKAKNMDEVVARAEEIFQITVDQAKLDRELAKKKADDAYEELRLQGEILDAKLQIAEADLTIAKINGKKTEKLEQEVKQLQRKSEMLQESLQVEEKIKQKKYEQADAIYNQAVKMAELNKKGNIQAGRERLITEEKKKQTAEMEKQNKLQGAINQQQAASKSMTRSVSTNMTAITKQLREQREIQDFAEKTGLPEEYARLAKQAERFRKEIKAKTWTDEFGNIVNKSMIAELNEGLRLTTLRMQDIKKESAAAAKEVANVYSAQGKGGVIKVGKENVGYGTMAQVPQYASGGYVNGAQMAVIGEAGPEYVVPSGRMDQVLANYAAGKRGNAVFSQQVNVSTGPVQQMDGTNYVTLQQATSMSQSAARQGAQMALSQIKSDPGTRRAIGVGS